MIALQEYDLEIKPSKVIRGHVLCKLLAKSKEYHSDGEDKSHLKVGWYNEFDVSQEKILYVPIPTNN